MMRECNYHNDEGMQLTAGGGGAGDFGCQCIRSQGDGTWGVKASVRAGDSYY